MDVALSDLLICPRCGPTYGLVLLPHDVADRRVRTGVLGCPNCRERFAVEEGVADLRAGAEVGTGSAGGSRTPGSPESASATDPETTGASADSRGGAGLSIVSGADAPEVRLAGVMGLAEAHGTVLLAGPVVAHAAALSELVEGVEVVAVTDEPEPSPAPGVSWMRSSAVLPLRSGSLRGVALTGHWASRLPEGARVLGGAGRLVVDPSPEDVRTQLESAGLSVVAEERGAVVAARRS